MPALRFCRSCAGPRPRAAIRCPWCQSPNSENRKPPEHLFGIYERQTRAPEDGDRQEETAP